MLIVCAVVAYPEGCHKRRCAKASLAFAEAIQLVEWHMRAAFDAHGSAKRHVRLAELGTAGVALALAWAKPWGSEAIPAEAEEMGQTTWPIFILRRAFISEERILIARAGPVAELAEA